MLLITHKSLRRALHPASSAATSLTAIRPIQCAVCTCQCGTQFGRDRSSSPCSAFSRNASTYTQPRPRNNAEPLRNRNTAQRGYAFATGSKAPSTRDRERRLREGAVSPYEATQLRAEEGEWSKSLWDNLNDLLAQGWISASPDAIVDLLNSFTRLLEKHKGRQIPVDHFRSLRDDHGVDFKDQYLVAKSLLVYRDWNRIYSFRGKRLLLNLSHAGYPDATIYIVNQALLQAKKNPAVMRSSEIRPALSQIDQLVVQGDNYKALVLAGKIARLQGKEDYAISLWTQAMAAAVTASEVKKDAPLVSPRNQVVEEDNLSSPWIELMYIHHERSTRPTKDYAFQAQEIRQLEWATEIGCQQDDPDAHYLKSTLLESDDGYSSEWLYHVTKAATTQHWKAAHNLAMYYAQSIWKYIDDEPPDAIKPTPFDSYPGGTITSAWTKTLQFLGLKPIVKPDPKENLFHSAAYPHAAVERFGLALMWLKVPADFCYAPSFLYFAELSITKTLYDGANVPISALQLSHDRYTFASREDFELNKPIQKPALPEGKEFPNPWYNLNQAKLWLREIFFAYEAHLLAIKALNKYATHRRRHYSGLVTDDTDLVEDSEDVRNAPIHIAKWLKYPDVREMYEYEMEDLHNKAKHICDTQGWDLYDDSNALVYRARRR